MDTGREEIETSAVTRCVFTEMLMRVAGFFSFRTGASMPRQDSVYGEILCSGNLLILGGINKVISDHAADDHMRIFHIAGVGTWNENCRIRHGC